MSFMSVYFNAPFNESQVKKLQEYQDGLEPMLCDNRDCHDIPEKAPVLFVTSGGLVCPDMNCANSVTSVPDYVITGRFRF